MVVFRINSKKQILQVHGLHTVGVCSRSDINAHNLHEIFYEIWSVFLCDLICKLLLGPDGRLLSITSTQKISWESENNSLSEMQRIYHTKEFRNTSMYKLSHSFDIHYIIVYSFKLIADWLIDIP